MSLTSSELHQTIRLAKIPDGWRMRVTAVNPITSDNNKYTSLISTPGGQVSNAEGAWNSFRPFEVTKWNQSNRVATVELEPHTTWDSRGPSGEIYFSITGTTIVNGQHVTAKSKGMIIVTSSKWSTFSRPDSSIVTVVLDGVARTMALPVPYGGVQPPAVQLFFSTNGGTVTMVAAPAEASLTDRIASAMIAGIFEAHVQLFTFGAGLPFAAAEAGAVMLAKSAVDMATQLTKAGALVLFASIDTYSRPPNEVQLVQRLTTC